MILKESRILELKKQYIPSVLKTVSVFATYETGTIVFGAYDNMFVVGVEDVDELKLKVENAIRDNISPLPHYSFKEVSIENKTLVKLLVIKGQDAPYFYKHQIFKRIDTSTAPIGNREGSVK